MINYSVYTDIKGRVVAAPNGYCNEEEARLLADAMLKEMGDKQGVLVFDARKLEGYSTKARQAWIKALFPRRKQMTQIFMVGSQSALTRMAATMVGAALGVSLSLCDTMEALDQEAAPRFKFSFLKSKEKDSSSPRT